MNSTALHDAVSTASGHGDRMSPSATAYQPRFARRDNLLDRAALQIGVALIRWGRRSYDIESREQLARRFELDRARSEHQLEAESWVLFHVVRR